MRYLFMQEIANYYATALQHQKDNKDMAMGQLGGIEEPDGGRLEDLREYTTRLRELYKDLWLSENHANWLPNMLQLYDRQSLMWQDMIARVDGIRSDFDQASPCRRPSRSACQPPRRSKMCFINVAASLPSPMRREAAPCICQPSGRRYPPGARA